MSITKGRRHLESLGQDIRDHIEEETQDNIARGMAPNGALVRMMVWQCTGIALFWYRRGSGRSAGTYPLDGELAL
jgi:hypothetical protein